MDTKVYSTWRRDFIPCVGLFTNAWALLLNQPIVICAEQAEQSVTL